MTNVGRGGHHGLELYDFQCCSAQVAASSAVVVHELADSIAFRSYSATMASRACAASQVERVGGEPR